MYPIIELAGKEIGTYALFAIAGFVICGLFASRRARVYDIGSEDIVILILCIAGGLLIGGHILYGITNIFKICAAFARLTEFNLKIVVQILAVGFGGSVFYGGFLGACAAIGIYSRFCKRVRRADLFDLLAVCTPLFHTFGRIGCFFGGCCYGIESAFGFIVYDNKLSPDINGVVRFPVQLLESLLNLIIFLILARLLKKERLKGKLIYIYMMLYPIVRFATEFLRGDEIRGIWFGFSTSQWISAVLFIFAAVALGKDVPACFRFKEKTKR